MRRVILTINGRSFDVTLLERRPDSLTFSCNDPSGGSRTYTAAVSPAVGAGPRTEHEAANSAPSPLPRARGNEIVAPIPGIVVSVSVEQGSPVKAGEAVAVIEAMKMENSIKCPRDSIIEEILVSPGAEVSTGQPLMRMKPL